MLGRDGRGRETLGRLLVTVESGSDERAGSEDKVRMEQKRLEGQRGGA